jgi:hypothetical protein
MQVPEVVLTVPFDVDEDGVPVVWIVRLRNQNKLRPSGQMVHEPNAVSAALVGVTQPDNLTAKPVDTLDRFAESVSPLLLLSGNRSAVR